MVRDATKTVRRSPVRMKRAGDARGQAAIASDGDSGMGKYGRTSETMVDSGGAAAVVGEAGALGMRVEPLVARVLYPLGKVVLPAYFGRLQVIGADRVPTAGPVIFAPTHRSRWDGILMCCVAGRYATGRDVRFMVTSNEMRGVQGWLLRRMGCFAIDPDCPSVAGVRRSIELLQAGEALTVFPEGDIFRDGELHALKPGLARMAIQAETRRPGLGCTIVPIAFHYADPAVPRGCHVSVMVGQPLRVDRYLGRDRKGAARQLMSDLTDALDQLNDARRPESSLAAS